MAVTTRAWAGQMIGQTQRKKRMCPQTAGMQAWMRIKSLAPLRNMAMIARVRRMTRWLVRAWPYSPTAPAQASRVMLGLARACKFRTLGKNMLGAHLQQVLLLMMGKALVRQYRQGPLLGEVAEVELVHTPGGGQCIARKRANRHRNRLQKLRMPRAVTVRLLKAVGLALRLPQEG
jgi:hypothetical protein